MKFYVFAYVLLAGFAAAQQEKLPSCAQPCINKYTTGDGIAGCGQFDFKCICGNQDFLDGIACCLEDECDASGRAAAVKYAGQICSSAGVDVPDEVVCKNTTSTGTPTASSGSAATTSADSGNGASRGSAVGLLGAAMAVLAAL
ncbi:cell wall [Fusarium albosuccineum]|uniref:Cell wall n=1 Tax=Fusarium albosuccineum TaxID=1237068 RepID=A0A8H4L2U2_9HYPO|nr:cell wall [Fusarium albosuccineum]